MHRTQSIDFGIVHRGEIYLEVDDEVERKMISGDVVVQRGSVRFPLQSESSRAKLSDRTMHSWVNKSNEWCRMYFILIGAEELKIGEVCDRFHRRAMEGLITSRTASPRQVGLRGEQLSITRFFCTQCICVCLGVLHRYGSGVNPRVIDSGCSGVETETVSRFDFASS